MLQVRWRTNMTPSLRRLVVFALFVGLSFVAMASSSAEADEPRGTREPFDGELHAGWKRLAQQQTPAEPSACASPPTGRHSPRPVRMPRRCHSPPPTKIPPL